MAHGHGHGARQSASRRHLGALSAAFTIAAAFMVVEPCVVGLATSSLALLSDAAHMLTDVIGVGLALIAIVIANRQTNRPNKTFGMYRAEVLAALAKRGAAVRCRRLRGLRSGPPARRPTRVPGLPVLIAATLGLLANITSLLLLRKDPPTA